MLRGAARPDLVHDEVLCELFTASAAAHADKRALVGPSGTFTYAEVELRARAIGAALAERGIRPGHVVGLWMPRGPELLIAQIGIAMSGAAWLPFDAEAPIERIGECLADCGAKALLTSAPLMERAKAAGATVLVDGALAASNAPAAEGAPVGPLVTPSRLCDLHLRLHRQAEGHHRHAREHLSFPAIGERGLRHSCR